MTTSCRRSLFLLATFFLLTLLVVALQAGPVAARALPAAERQEGGEDYHVFLPLISNIPANTISGQVTREGTGAAAYYVALDLYHIDNGWLRNDQLAITDANGHYQFSDVPNLPADKFYVVRYENDINAGNGFDPRCLSFWLSQSIFSSTASGIDFDIADIQMTDVSDTQTFPITFHWDARSTPGEEYEFFLYGPGFDPAHYFYNPGVFEYTLNNLPPFFSYDNQYYWGVYVYGESGGYGLSLVYPIVFTVSNNDTTPLVLPQRQLQFPKAPVVLHREMVNRP